MLDFQKLDPFWNLWSKPNPGVSSKMLYLARLNRNLERKIGHEIFVKTEKTEYLSILLVRGMVSVISLAIE